jgi:tetratricopeptide (TPR) repeat protein
LNVKKEPLVLVGALAIVGLMVYPEIAGKKVMRSSRGEKAPSLVAQAVPDVATALPRERDSARVERDLFAPPRDTRPLAPLALEEPPLGALPALRPPPEPGVRPALLGRFLRALPTPKNVPGLFVTEVEDAGDFFLEDEVVAGEESESVDGSTLEMLKGLGYAGDDTPLTPEQREAQIANWKSLYDWVRISEGSPQFGQIRNEDRFGLPQRPQEPIEFLEVIPETGKPRHDMVIPYGRDRVTEFAFADTVANQIALRRKPLGEKITTAQYLPVLEFADWCLERRGEAPEALNTAVELYRLAQTVSDKEITPRLGLARCYEAGFDFEKAFLEYEAMISGGVGGRAEVHARLGQLEARLRLFDSAEAHLLEAEKRERSSWEVQWAKGRFLYERGRYAEALAALELAFRFEPGPERRRERIGIRLDLAAARLAQGQLEGQTGALAMSNSVLQADQESQRGLAGLFAAAYLGATAELPPREKLAADGLGFELLVALALNDLEAERFEAARDGLTAAAEADPLRAHVAWRALSWLAEITGYPIEAQTWIERAHEADPTDAYTLYQLGRVRLANDDPDGAERAFVAALDQELDFVDCLVAMGELNYLRGDYEAAERFYERAVSQDGERPELHARRGFNLLRLNDVARAAESFQRAARLNQESPDALAGSAWCKYLGGDPAEAISLFAALDDQRRAEPEEDDWRVFAREQIDRISEHEVKEAWTDRFERRLLRLDWGVEEAAGPVFSMLDGQLVLGGAFKQANGSARVYKTYPAPLFVSMEMDVTVDSSSKARVGVFVSKERLRRQGESQILSMHSIERHPEGGLQVRLQDRRATAEIEREDIAPVGTTPWWPADRPVRLRIERIGEGSESIGRISIDGIGVREGFPMSSNASSGDVHVGLFAEGDTGRPVKVLIDNVEVVYKTR